MTKKKEEGVHKYQMPWFLTSIGKHMSINLRGGRSNETDNDNFGNLTRFDKLSLLTYVDAVLVVLLWKRHVLPFSPCLLGHINPTLSQNLILLLSLTYWLLLIMNYDSLISIYVPFSSLISSIFTFFYKLDDIRIHPTIQTQ